MTDEATWQAALADTAFGDRWRLYGPFADWLEEHGDWRAAGYRWLHEWEREPYMAGLFSWTWRDKTRFPKFRRLPLCDTSLECLTWALLSAVCHDAAAACDGPTACSARFPTRQAAEEAVCRAIHHRRYRPKKRARVCP